MDDGWLAKEMAETRRQIDKMPAWKRDAIRRENAKPCAHDWEHTCAMVCVEKCKRCGEVRPG